MDFIKISLPYNELLTNDNIRRYGYGPVESAAHGVQFGQARFTWMVDSRGKILNFFNDWMSSIVNFDSKGGVDIGIESDLRDEFYPYEVGYKDDYSNSNMKIFIYDSRHDTVAEYQLFDVFPQRVEDVPLSWTDSNSPVGSNLIFSSPTRTKPALETTFCCANNWYK